MTACVSLHRSATFVETTLSALFRDDAPHHSLVIPGRCAAPNPESIEPHNSWKNGFRALLGEPRNDGERMWPCGKLARRANFRFAFHPTQMFNMSVSPDRGRIESLTHRRANNLDVVPAKAGIHNHEWLLSGDAGSTSPVDNIRCGVWVPAPVRNCALGRDDDGRGRGLSAQAPTPLSTGSATCAGDDTEPAV